jgi:hypothetical protein
MAAFMTLPRLPANGGTAMRAPASASASRNWV